MSDTQENLVIRVKDQDGEETVFKIKRKTKMRKVFTAYAEHKGVELDSVSFFINSIRIQPDQTPRELGLKEDDIIEYKLEQDANISTNSVSTETKPEVADAEKITIGIKDQDGDITHFKIRKNTIMKKVFSAYTNRKGVQLESVRFLFDGIRISHEQTPDQLELEDKDVIHYLLQQEGGNVLR